jgi:UDP-glucose 6-dehydrogenase
MKKPLIGFIGQGWIGKHYADDYENRGHAVVRYSLEAPYNQNKDKIRDCDIVFIAVPTPTTPKGFDNSILRSVFSLVGKGKIAIVKSTLPMGQTRILQAGNPHCLVVHSPEFLSESTAAHDAANPSQNIVGIPKNTPKYQEAAKQALSVMAKAPFELVCTSNEAELIKYAHNVHGYFQVVLSNLLYDLARAHKNDWTVLKSAFLADPFMSHRYLSPIDKKGRGAGGHCFIKDFETFIEYYRSSVDDKKGVKILESLRDKNVELLVNSGKDLDLVEGVYGKKVLGLKKKTNKVSGGGIKKKAKTKVRT